LRLSFEKKKKGVNKVTSLLPFLLLGGFSLPEMVAYLKQNTMRPGKHWRLLMKKRVKSNSLASPTQKERAKSAGRRSLTRKKKSSFNLRFYWPKGLSLGFLVFN